jgi:hypothetical protein
VKQKISWMPHAPAEAKKGIIKKIITNLEYVFFLRYTPS